ncbi:MAG: LysR family transcriptional regulator [Noviherbaspirillum sp.]|nr:LysR family transcriptional regulator [Noviherbaspirillum sp.]
MNLSLRQLRVFLGVAHSSSFTKTAQRLHLSQAALSAIIRELETQLQCRLLDRTTRTVKLTEAGRIFLPTAAHIVATIENAAVELARIGRAEQRALRVGVTPHIAVSLMPEVLKTFSMLYPSVHVEMSDRPPAELLCLVESGELDAAFGAFFAKASGIDRVPIFPTRLVVASAQGEGVCWPDFSRYEVTWRAFQGLPLICLPDDNPIQRLIDENLANEQVAPGRRIVVSHLETAIAMADAGFGIAILPSISEATCRRFRVRLDPIEPPVEFAFYCIMQAGRGDSGVIAQFSQVLREVAERFHHGGPAGTQVPQ